MLKRNGVREKYSREKIFTSIMTACSKCGIHAEIIDEIIDKIELDLLMSGKREISTYYLGDKVLEFLKELNEIAYIRYLSIFKQFQTLEDLARELSNLTKQVSVV
jgi:transcriptional repressor NrdR